jgi:hypothetical protein
MKILSSFELLLVVVELLTGMTYLSLYIDLVKSMAERSRQQLPMQTQHRHRHL